jgi:ferredoxin
VQNDPVTEQTTAPGTGGDTVTGGLAKAVEMCNNNGHCRKFDAGTMCPSYRVTRDEQHLTRGRANTLRLALSASWAPTPDHRDAMHEAMDLCVSCKGCKRDCPTGVDMAQDEGGVPGTTTARHGHTLKDKLVGHLPDYAAWASRVPWLLNLRNRCPALARLGERWLGLSARRALPRLGRHLLAHAAATRRLQRRDDHAGRAAAASGWRCCSSTPSTAASKRERLPPRAGAAGRGLCAAHRHQARRPATAAAAPICRPAWWTKARPSARTGRRPAALAQAGIAVVGLEPAAC